MKNKGFAITALLYGLSIMGLMTVVLMMSIMQNSRKNTSSLVRGVEQELNTYGQTSTTYDEGSPRFIVPSDQTGYYKIELFGGGNGGSMVSGTIYLTANTVLNIDLPNNGVSTIKVNDETNPIMKAGKNAGDIYVNGMAKYVTVGAPGNYHFLNGQAIAGVHTVEKGKVRINKVSADTPNAAHSSLNGIGCIKTNTTAAKTTIQAIEYQSGNATVVTKKTTNNNKLGLGGQYNLSELSVSFTEDKASPTITVYSSTDCSGSAKATIAGAKDLDDSAVGTYTFVSGTEATISRYTPFERTITTGNYSIVPNNKSSNKYTINQKYTLSTSAYTPTSNPYSMPATSRPTQLIYYGDESMGRPVIITNYKGENSQKWRIEKSEVDENLLRVSEIEEYKPFEVHKYDTSQGDTGPVLMCGQYYWKDGFVSTDDYTKNWNQQWEFIPAGLGMYVLKTNSHHSPAIKRYLYCTGSDSNNRCYVTETKNNASIFKIFNTNL